MRAHSRHLMPTAAGTMQSGQIGFPQFEHETAVSTFGWLAQYTVVPVDTAASVASGRDPPTLGTSDHKARGGTGPDPLTAGGGAGVLAGRPRPSARRRATG